MEKALHDTLSVAKRLKGAGMNELQAEAVAEAIRGGIGDATAHLATKDDLAAARRELQSDMKAMESRLEGKMSAMESRLEGRMTARESQLNAGMAAQESRFDTGMAAQASRFDASISALESRLLWRLSGMMLGVGGIAIAVLRLMPA